MSPAFHECLARGIALFNQQEFYEAHEAWEQGWIDELGDERTLLQGLIQIAAGFYKLQTGSPSGTLKLLDRALEKLRPFRRRSQGVNLERLIPEVEWWRAVAEQLVVQNRRDYDPGRIPRVEYEATLH